MKMMIIIRFFLKDGTNYQPCASIQKTVDLHNNDEKYMNLSTNNLRVMETGPTKLLSKIIVCTTK